MGRVLMITLLAALAHVISTLLIGLVVGFFGFQLSESADAIMQWIAPTILIFMGAWFIYQHHHHRHFHLEAKIQEKMPITRIVFLLMLAMFFSPCLEITSLFFAGGAYGWEMILYMSLIYAVFTIGGMMAWVSIAYKGLLKTDWHAIEHNAGIISGVALIVSGILFAIL